ncbi:Zn-dependent hydrolase [Elioraea sp. Yellowstone]|uniref:Zn-dependent hydrolase n=1 Tax=Elioraea sp. Yellowstone TaxID=2592070 RepID=UPI0011546D90|nr:Zn-dependent hydrolase [Elioraea sp. Yellowstone]TQF78435.1 Zn-dependent hydrolase [Elioraea sp. Yellowstone]
MDNLPVSGQRLWDSLMEMARIGATPKGGCNRQALTDLDGRARHLLRHWCEALGLTMTVDRVGNMAFRREGADPARKPVAIGSHLDTQPTGGRFDGVLGVLAGLETLRALDEAGIRTRAPILLVNWTNEEGARFSPPMMGSGVAVGVFTEEEILAKTDPAGAVFGRELARIGWQGEADPAWARDLAAYLELHIEQGPLLEAEGAIIGVVTGASAQAWFEVTVAGAEAHGGNGMAMRRDALVAASLMIAAVEGIALEHGGNGTVGRLTLSPDSRNVVPGRVWFTVDLRHPDEAGLDRMVRALHTRIGAIAAARRVAATVAPFWSAPATPFDPTLVGHVRAAAEARGYAHRDMPTGIGHDAVYLARAVPTAMIFVPCHGGLSHNEAESITPDWAEAGCRVLADAVLAAAERA